MKPTILILDDEESILENVDEILRMSGYDTLLGKNGQEGLEIMKSHRPDLIVSDVMMPEMDGFEFHRIVRQNPAWTTIPIILLSAKAEKSDVQYGYQLGVDHYLTKPFDPDELLTQIRSRLKRAEEIQDVVRSELDRLKRPLLNGLDNELSAPLGLIHHYLEVYQERKSELRDAEAGEISRIMDQTLKRMTKLLEDLMLIVYIDSGAVEVEINRLYQPINLDQEIEDLIDQFSDLALQRSIQIQNHTPPDLVIHGHVHFVVDIYRRLIDNAIKFSSLNGHVWIEAEKTHEGVWVSICDDGMGIAKNQLGEIFKSFDQMDRIKIERQGLGLGLAIASRLAQLHGGEIQVQSELGNGSIFKVWLPISLGVD